MISSAVRTGQLNSVVKVLEIARIGVSEGGKRTDVQRPWEERKRKTLSMASTAFSLASEERAVISVWIISFHEHGHIKFISDRRGKE
jgi:hypothetical protein